MGLNAIVEMKKLLVLLFFVVPFCSNAQNTSNQATYTQSNDSQWEKLGYVFIYKASSYYSCGRAIVYSRFDGDKMKYKIFIPQTNDTYDVCSNPALNPDAVEYCNKKWENDNRFQGPADVTAHPQKAGDYYFNIGHIF